MIAHATDVTYPASMDGWRAGMRAVQTRLLAVHRAELARLQSLKRARKFDLDFHSRAVDMLTATLAREGGAA